MKEKKIKIDEKNTLVLKMTEMLNRPAVVVSLEKSGGKEIPGIFIDSLPQKEGEDSSEQFFEEWKKVFSLIENKIS